jgi:uncharacterized membrane protein YecN with MAPEG domain
MPFPHVSLLYGGLLGLLVTLLGLRVSLLRIRGGKFVGPKSAPPAELLLPIRAHGNATEWVPLGLVLLLALELSGRLSSGALHGLGGTLLLGRVLHAAGFYTGTKLSTVGATLTYLVLLAMAAWAVRLAF